MCVWPSPMSLKVLLTKTRICRLLAKFWQRNNFVNYKKERKEKGDWQREEEETLSILSIGVLSGRPGTGEDICILIPTHYTHKKGKPHKLPPLILALAVLKANKYFCSTYDTFWIMTNNFITWHQNLFLPSVLSHPIHPKKMPLCFVCLRWQWTHWKTPKNYKNKRLISKASRIDTLGKRKIMIEQRKE